MVSAKLAKKTKVIRENGGEKRFSPVHIPKSIKQRINNRRKMARELRKMKEGSEERKKKEEEYLAEKVSVAKDARKFRVKRWHEAVHEAMESLHNGNSDRFWHWICTMCGKRGMEKAAAPIKDPSSGRILTNPKEIRDAWASHYEKLASDETGHSKDKEYWERKVDGVDKAELWDQRSNHLASNH
jgi:hypothetical protein